MRGLSRNLVSQAGVVIAVVAMANTIFLIVVDAAQKQSNPYMGILAWIVAPAILCAGLALYLLGILVEQRRRGRTAQASQYPVVDFNQRRTRTAVVVSAVGMILFVVASVIGTYHAYHYTEKDAFCGGVCHQVMGPEFTAYQRSPHARVGCVECHVGSGAEWYVRSKITGTHQLWALMTKEYPRPIPTPVRGMRPARQTCEQCHWPEKFFGTQLKTFEHFAYDETSTPHRVQLLIKTGGGSPGGLTAGIHWHMNIANEVTYIAGDEHRQQIPWVRIRDRAGHVTEYLAEGSKLTAAQIAASPQRRMDCIDCHSRPAHIFVPPDHAVDRALAAGSIDRTLPFVKQQAVAVLAKEYPSTPAALRAISTELPAYYRKTYPGVYAAKKPAIDRAVSAVQQIFSTTRFPEMKVDWRTHPDNVGHFSSLGCFRCHDDQHVSRDGKRLSKDCQLCHSVLNAGQSSASFEHPVDLGDLRSVNCSDCHTGGGM